MSAKELLEHLIAKNEARDDVRPEYIAHLRELLESANTP